MVDARLHDDPVRLDLLSLPPAVSPLTALQLAVDERRVERNTRGKSLHDGRQRGPMRLTGGQVSQHDSFFIPIEIRTRSVYRRPRCSSRASWRRYHRAT